MSGGEGREQPSKAAPQGREAVPGMLIFPLFLAVAGPYPAGFHPPGAEERGLSLILRYLCSIENLLPLN